MSRVLQLMWMQALRLTSDIEQLAVQRDVLEERLNFEIENSNRANAKKLEDLHVALLFPIASFFISNVIRLPFRSWRRNAII